VRVWETLFWNRRVDTIYTLPGTMVFGPVPQTTIRVKPDGRIVPAHPPASRSAPGYVVAPLGQITSVPAYTFVGRQLAYIPQPGSRSGGTALWQIEPPLRLASRATGLQPNGDIYPGGDGHLVAYGCTGNSHFQLTLLVKQPQTITILRNGTPYRRLHYPAPGAFRGAIPALLPPTAPPGTSECTLDIRPTGLLGTTVFELQP